ncbi:MAG: hypothetical protein Q8T11_04480 [Elusimicrobiota bacterium]|nr:hypothetical protein [Elusimicrobiota bacterium]
MRTHLAAALIVLAAASPAWALIGLAMRFGDVILEGVQPGRTYSLREAARVPLGVENRGDAEAEVIIEFSKPRKGNYSKDYEPIPDPSWIKAVPDRMTLAAHSVGFFDLMLTVPDDPKLLKRHFQVMVKARSGGTGLLGVAVENRVRFSVGPGPQSIAAEKKQKAMQRLDFDVTPRELYLVDVPVGKAWDARKEVKKSIRVANYAADPLTVVMASDAWDERIPLPEGYAKIPDPAWIRLKTSTISVGTDEIVQASVVVLVPDKPENRGKRWASTIRTGLASGFWLDAPVKVFLETSP